MKIKSCSIQVLFVSCFLSVVCGSGYASSDSRLMDVNTKDEATNADPADAVNAMPGDADATSAKAVDAKNNNTETVDVMGVGVETTDADSVASSDTDEVRRILALSDDVAFGEYLAGECASCHTTEVVDGSNVPVIHGAEPAYLVRALLEYRAGTRDNSTMALVANGLAEDEVAALAHYLETVQP